MLGVKLFCAGCELNSYLILHVSLGAQGIVVKLHCNDWACETKSHQSPVPLWLFSRSVVSDSLQPHRLQHARFPCPSQIPRACSDSCPLSESWHPTISSSVVPFSSCLQSFPASRSFLMSWLFFDHSSGGQSITASASSSVLPINIQDWFPLGLTSLISLQSQGLSRVFSNTNTSSLVLCLLYGPTLTFVHDYWKNHRFDYTVLCWQSNISAF